MTKGQIWYRDVFLPSLHFRSVREKRYQKYPYCEICGQKFHLDPHHISYERRGTKLEWKDVRMLCHHHHTACHFILWVIRIPRTPAWLYSRYMFVKIRSKIWRFILTYRIGS